MQGAGVSKIEKIFHLLYGWMNLFTEWRKKWHFMRKAEIEKLFFFSLRPTRQKWDPYCTLTVGTHTVKKCNVHLKVLPFIFPVVRIYLDILITFQEGFLWFPAVFGKVYPARLRHSTYLGSTREGDGKIWSVEGMRALVHPVYEVTENNGCINMEFFWKEFELVFRLQAEIF